MSSTLTPETIDDAVFNAGTVDPVDTLRRIATEWIAFRRPCNCGENAACSICEIDYLLDEAFQPREQVQESTHMIVMPSRVWRKMTPQEYAEQHQRLGRHVAVSQEIVDGCQEVWVYLGGSIQFQ